TPVEQAAGDPRTPGMFGEPPVPVLAVPSPGTQQFVDLGLVHPVVLLAAVHGGQQHVQVAEGIRQAQSSGEGEGKVVGVAPARKFWVERYRFGADPPTE